jgi:hypothetical protein
MRRIQWVLCLLCLSMTVYTALAQASCPELVQDALAATDEYCAETERNEACYGNISINAELADGVTFEKQGDRVPLAAVESLELAGLDTAAGTWGVTLIRAQADIPESLPGANLTFLLFGDVAIENAAEGDLTPMQAFYFKSGVGSPDCAEAPDGILVQTPEGVAEVSFTVNGANVTLGSTAFFQTRLHDEGKPPSLTMSVLEGQGTIEAFGVKQPVFAGSWVRVPIDADFNVAAAPNPPKPYQFGKDDLGVLPVNQLETSFEPSQSLTQEQIDTLLAANVVTSNASKVSLTLENTLSEAITLTIPGIDMLLFAPGESQTVEVFAGMYRWTACAAENCISQSSLINESTTMTIDEALFE